MNYSIKEVQEKVDNYLGENKTFTVNSNFSRVENLRASIESAIKKSCLNNNLKYQLQFSQVLDRLEGGILSSKNWFNEDGLNFTNFRSCLKIKVEKKEEFLENLELRYNISGNKLEKNYDIKELLAVGQSGRYQQDTEGYRWTYFKSLRFKNISIVDNSDAYQDKVIDFKASAKGAIIKGFDSNYKENTLLLVIHYHSYSEEKETDGKNCIYCPSLEKFELVLLV